MGSIRVDVGPVRICGIYTSRSGTGTNRCRACTIRCGIKYEYICDECGICTNSFGRSANSCGICTCRRYGKADDVCVARLHILYTRD